MNRWIARAAGVLAVTSLSATVALAGPPKAAKTECPVCHMALSAKKSDDNTVAVRLKKGGKVMYCCAKCKMPASVLVKAKGGKM